MSNLPAPTGSNPKPGSTTPASAPVTHSYENYSSDQLEPLLADASSTLESLKTAANPAYAELIKSNAEKVSTLEQALIRAFRREKIAKSTLPVQPVDTKPVIVSGQQNQWERRVQQHVSNLPTFTASSPEELTQFVTRLEHMHGILVKSHDRDSETFFLEELKLKLDPQIVTRLDESGEITDSKSLIKWLRETYGEHHTSYQLLSKPWNAEYKPGTPFLTYASTIEREMRTAYDHIKTTWAKNNSGQVLSGDDTCALFTGMLMVEVVRKDNPVVYQTMTPRLDKLTTAAKVAAEADRIRTQFGSQALSASENTFYAPKSAKPKTSKSKPKPSTPEGVEDRVKRHDSELKSIQSILSRIEKTINGNPSPSQTSEGKSKGSKRRDQKKSQKKEEKSAHTADSEATDQSMYTTDGALTCPDMTEAVLKSTQGFH